MFYLFKIIHICYQLFDQRLSNTLKNTSKDISDCYEHRVLKIKLSIFEVPFKTFYAAELVKYLHKRFRIINELLYIELYQ